ncbi:MAG: hypothetical protein PHE15_05005 [Dehalococcoidales bacterium]|nr:hypothetical protein [Dehalococcoidales bacterium]
MGKVFISNTELAQRYYREESFNEHYNIGSIGQASPSFASIGIGKGVKETSGQQRLVNVFGAELNMTGTAFYNLFSPVVISEPTKEFDLSTITPNHEVVVCGFRASNVTTESHGIFKWYRVRDRKLLYSGDFIQPAPPEGLTWNPFEFLSVIGYVPWEINENGDYMVDMTFKTAYQESPVETIGFTVTGIKEAPPEPSIEVMSPWAIAGLLGGAAALLGLMAYSSRKSKRRKV